MTGTHSTEKSLSSWSRSKKKNVEGLGFCRALGDIPPVTRVLSLGPASQSSVISHSTIMGTKPFLWPFWYILDTNYSTFECVLHSPSFPHSWPQMDQAFQNCHRLGQEGTLLCTLVTSSPSPLKTNHLHVLSIAKESWCKFCRIPGIHTAPQFLHRLFQGE